MRRRSPEHLRAVAKSESLQLARQLMAAFDDVVHRDRRIGGHGFGIGIGFGHDDDHGFGGHHGGSTIHDDMPADGQLQRHELPIEAFHDIDDLGDGDGKVSFRELASAFLKIDREERLRLLDELREPLDVLAATPRLGWWGFATWALGSASGMAGMFDWRLGLVFGLAAAGAFLRTVVGGFQAWRARRHVTRLLDDAFGTWLYPQDEAEAA